MLVTGESDGLRSEMNVFIKLISEKLTLTVTALEAGESIQRVCNVDIVSGAAEGRAGQLEGRLNLELSCLGMNVRVLQTVISINLRGQTGESTVVRISVTLHSQYWPHCPMPRNSLCRAAICGEHSTTNARHLDPALRWDRCVILHAEFCYLIDLLSQLHRVDEKQLQRKVQDGDD